MMHGYLAFDADGSCWRRSGPGATPTPAPRRAASALFGHNIPHRWSIAHLYQAILDGEDHVAGIAHLTTLAGYVHWKLTGEKVLGVGDASGMFPIDVATGGYDAEHARTHSTIWSPTRPDLHVWPTCCRSPPGGEPAGTLTEAGARLLDPCGALRPGMPLCPPEGDAGTGMVATNSVAPRTGNVSAGTSIFAMVVLEHPLSRVHHELDLVTTPAGDLVAMVHCNNGASELDSWAGLFAEFAAALGADRDQSTVFETLFRSALDGAPDGGGLMAFNYLSGEPITGLTRVGRCFCATPDSTLRPGHLHAHPAVRRAGHTAARHGRAAEGRAGPARPMFAHGGLFPTEGVAQGFLAAAINTQVSVGATASEGGAGGSRSLPHFYSTGGGPDPDRFLSTEVFAEAELSSVEARRPADVSGFDAFMQRYVAALPVPTGGRREHLILAEDTHDLVGELSHVLASWVTTDLPTRSASTH